MPELAEVEYYRKQWLPALGLRVTALSLHAEQRVFRGVDTTAMQADLIGQALTDSASHGKQMCFRFGEQYWLGVHLGMTGKTCMIEANYRAERHDHLVLHMEDGCSLLFTDPRMFGRILYTRSSTSPAWWATLPPEILSEGFTFQYMSRFLNRRAKSSMKAVLMMQEAFPGIGNWMADEILWRAQILPDRRPCSLSEPERERLYRVVREVCEDALRVISTDWGTPPDNWLFNHRWKAGGICPQTGQALARGKIGGRTTCWSPAWQH